ncbi:MAG TPA: hypothetical protein VI997_09225 [Candidatus Thermoplasmatota archaeon]|nr:hypothetical protein [Candidatus Thermoplasmatota archaeon]
MRVSAVALVASFLISGCLDSAPVESAVAEDSDGVPEVPAALPDEREGEFVAFQETNATEPGVGGLDHHHDYWLGRDRVELVQDRFPFNPYGTTPYRGLTLPAGALVFEGTATVEVVIRDPQRHACFPAAWSNGKPTYCTDAVAPGAPDPSPPGVTLEYIHAATTEWIDAGPLVWGEPLVIPVEPKETDMPHAVGSLWRFRVRTSEAPTSATSSFEATVTIVRGAEIAQWPGHPAFYTDSHVRRVLDGVGRTKEPGVAAWYTGTDSDWNYTDPTPDKLISYGTRALRVTIDVTKNERPPGMHTTAWWLGVQNATGRWIEAAPLEPPKDPDAPGAMTFVVAVDDGGMDSPYATRSRWQFELWPSDDPPADGVPAWYTYGYVPFDVQYRIVVDASDLAASPVSKFR